MFSIDGLVSGFDTTSIIESLLEFQQTQVDTYTVSKDEIATEQSAFKGIEAQLLTLQTSMQTLNRTNASVFDVRSATSSNEDVITAVADSGANSGSFQLKVNSLATAHQVGSQGFASSSEQIASGDVTIQVGNHAAQTISIGEGNNTVSGFVSTFNEQVDDAKASVIFDQGSDSYRILLTSDHTGEENEISIIGEFSGEGVLPDFSGPAVQDPSNAIVTLGSGLGAIVAEYSSNTIDELVEGVTLDLKTTSPETAITINIESDTESAADAIEGFVANFNSLMEFIDTQTEYLPETEQAGPLQGNRSVSTIKNNLLTSVTESISNPDGVRRLSQIGVDLNTQGKLEIDSAKLNDALSGEIDDVDPRDIRKLFGLNATSNHTGIEFISGSQRTVGSATPYEVNITQAALQGSITATTALAESTTIDDTNNTFQVTIDGNVSDILTLENGTYDRDELAEQMQDLINASDALGNRSVVVGVDADNQLRITSDAYGDDSRVASFSGSAGSSLGFTGIEEGDGQDVAGVFIVNGVEEIAIGNGRVLTGDPDNENTADLQLRVTLTENQVSEGTEGLLSVSRGVSGNINLYVDSILDTETGLLTNVNEDFDLRLESIEESIERVESITESKRDALLAEFAALETVLSELQTTGSFITSQLSSISSVSSS